MNLGRSKWLLKVLKFPLTHSCTRDPNLKYQLEMENDIENLADTTKDNSRDIFNKVCLKYPSAATRECRERAPLPGSDGVSDRPAVLVWGRPTGGFGAHPHAEEHEQC